MWRTVGKKRASFPELIHVIYAKSIKVKPYTSVKLRLFFQEASLSILPNDPSDSGKPHQCCHRKDGGFGSERAHTSPLNDNYHLVWGGQSSSLKSMVLR